MPLVWNPKIKQYKHGRLLGEGFYGKVYELDDKRVLKVIKMKDSQNRFIEQTKYKNLGVLQQQHNFINKTLEYFIDDSYIYEVQERIDNSVRQLMKHGTLEYKKELLNKTLDFVKFITTRVCHGDLHMGNIGIKDNRFVLIDTLDIQQSMFCPEDISHVLSNIIIDVLYRPGAKIQKYIEPPFKKLGQVTSKLLNDKDFLAIWNKLKGVSIIQRQQISLLIYEYQKKKTKQITINTHIKIWKQMLAGNIDAFRKTMNRLMDQML